MAPFSLPSPHFPKPHSYCAMPALVCLDGFVSTLTPTSDCTGLPWDCLGLPAIPSEVSLVWHTPGMDNKQLMNNSVNSGPKTFA